MRPLAYLAWVAGSILTLAVLTVALTTIVDPYRLFGTAEIAGWTALKPRIYEQRGIAKTYQLERIVPATLLLGNSRVEIGLDPESAQWPRDSGPVFNAAEGGASLFVAWRRLQEAIAVSPPKVVILGLDFPDFLERPSDPQASLPPPSADERRLLVNRDGLPNPDRPAQIWRDQLAATLTIDGLLDSIITLTDQKPWSSVTMTTHGFNPLHEYRVHVQRSGYYALFAQKNAVYQKQYGMSRHPDFDDTSRSASFHFLDRIMLLAQEHSFRLILFIPPYHAQYLDILHQAKLWSSFEAWKRALVRTISARSDPLRGSITLLDFSGYNQFTTEPVPRQGDLRTEMSWYWESGHYKPALGDEIIARFFGAKSHFGQELTPSTIDAVLADIGESRIGSVP